MNEQLEGSSVGQTRTLQLRLTPEQWRGLEDEATSRQISVDDLVTALAASACAGDFGRRELSSDEVRTLLDKACQLEDDLQRWQLTNKMV